ncbi:acyl-CoA dehydrogenase [Halorientalis pallida]|uniref:Acyl-CoA dehydrogenase n=1 Tax=Halorientalis pallida TaxID=2479928 RepID=A0A498KTY1_9EURY|nr:acyl-CoA dehydrogenase [Halorientalis pallida]RXK47775.1 acyl-CoA dehydrogenase [Halorientalis pallida]
MSNFKSGSGNLDFGSDDEETAESESNTSESEGTPGSEAESGSEEPTAEVDSAPDRNTDNEGTESQTSSDDAPEYPYFVRRNNVGDERDTRLEIHVRDNVVAQESEFRNKLAEHLDANDIAKTDAREFALLAAFENPQVVAELMEEEGFGAI